MAKIDPTFGMIGGLLQDAVLTPYVKDNYLFGGFSMYADKPTEEPLQVIQ